MDDFFFLFLNVMAESGFTPAMKWDHEGLDTNRVWTRTKTSLLLIVLYS